VLAVAAPKVLGQATNVIFEGVVSTMLPAGTAKVAIEAGIALGWREIVGDAGEIVSIDHYGSSAPGTALFEEYGFTADNVAERAHQALAHTHG